ncbi:MAG: hypothetical protein K8E66_10430, partial [Phycisphaerales bacterium]|nr:hypothetical protein [Phycisphaerales bacterium]
AAGANAVILAGAVGMSFVGLTEGSLLGTNVEFQFSFFVLFSLLLLVWRGAGPFSIDHLLRIDEETEPEIL